MKKMTNEDFEKWVPLIHHIIRVHFSWSCTPHGGGSFNTARTVSYDDLVSEGSLALFHSWRRFDPARQEASFKTYAYRAIVRRLRKYIDANISPISTKNWRDHVRNGVEVSTVAAAMGTSVFSEIDGSESRVQADEVPNQTDDSDWSSECLKLLKAQLTKREYAILLERAKGKTFSQIARKRGMTRETARKLHSELMVKAASILQDMDNG